MDSGIEKSSFLALRTQTFGKLWAKVKWVKSHRIRQI
jgi:hypothetical protein